MRAATLAMAALWLLSATPAAAPAETLGEPSVGFSAERVLVFDGHRYVGRMWSMPGEQRHEQDLPAVKPIFILHADSTIGDILLPQLHTAVEFVLPPALAVLSKPDLLGKPSGAGCGQRDLDHEIRGGQGIPEGHARGFAVAQPRRHPDEMRRQLYRQEGQSLHRALGIARRQDRRRRMRPCSKCRTITRNFRRKRPRPCSGFAWRRIPSTDAADCGGRAKRLLDGRRLG